MQMFGGAFKVARIGGIDIEIPKTTRDIGGSGRTFQKGMNHFDGAKALDYVRQRHGLPGVHAGQRLGRSTEEAGGTGVEGLHAPVGIDHEDPVGQRVEVAPAPTVTDPGLRRARILQPCDVGRHRRTIVRRGPASTRTA